MFNLSNQLFNTSLLCLVLLGSTTVTATANCFETINSEETPILKIEIDKQFDSDRPLQNRQLLQLDQQLQQLDYQQQQQLGQQWLRDRQQQQLQQQNIYVPLQ
ncbi:MAG: hypothetical protein WBA77_04220 [Microcoleaceae cyanobacterium]